MSYHLPQLLFGRPITADLEADEPEVLASSPGLGLADARAWAELASLSPLSTAAEDYAIGIFADPEQGEWLLARCHYHHADPQLPTQQFIPLPSELVKEARGGLLRLASLLREPPALDDSAAPSLSPLEVPPALLRPSPRPRALAALPLAIPEVESPPIPALLSLLNAALSPGGLLIAAAPQELKPRLALVAALQALLPRAAPQLTFSANAPQSQAAAARIRFHDGGEHDGGLRHYQWGERGLADELLPYPAHLLRCWQDGGETAILAELKELDRIAARRLGDRPLATELAALAERQDLAHRIQTGRTVDMERIKALLRDETPPSARHLPLYLGALLREELENHDSGEAALIARFMDAKPALDRQLNAQLEVRLTETPDAVYRFLRQRLHESTSPRWRERLQRAAEAALRIAIDEGDGAIIAAWLQLIAREPADFALESQLRAGITAASAPAREDGALGAELLSLATHFAHVNLPALLEDAGLLGALPKGLAEALRGAHDDHALDYAALPRELLALALARMTDMALAQEDPPPVIGEAGAAALWEYAMADNLRWLPAEYQARRTIERWLAAPQPPLREEARQTLIGAMLRDGADEDFRQACSRWGVPAPAIFAGILRQSGRPLDELLAHVNRLGQEGVLEPLAERDTYEAMWGADHDEGDFPIVEQLAWWTETHPELPAPLPLCWRLLTAAAAAENAAVARIALRRALANLEGANAAEDLVSALAEAEGVLAWSEELRAVLASWWRGKLSAADQETLRALVTELAERPALAEALTATQTALALRSLVGPADAHEFAAQLRRTLASLQALAQAFEPLATRDTHFDGEAAQAELRSNAGGLSQEEAAVLGKDCQELAHLLTQLAEHRTRGNVRRSGEELERRLMSGSQPPGGAIDALKWLAGFWGGIQTRQQRADDGDEG